jgi:16S rRNA (guanine527-N7)-methyltransferase
MSDLDARTKSRMSSKLRAYCDRFELTSDQNEKLFNLAALSVDLRISGTAIATLPEAIDVHIADSLAGLEVEAVANAGSIADIGSGVGFPGLVLAIAKPNSRVILVDSVRKKMVEAASMAEQIGIVNVECMWARAEEISAIGGEDRESYDVVTARALSSLNVLVEYAAPLLKLGGKLVAWKGSPDQEELENANAAEAAVGFEPGQLIKTKPFKSSNARHFYIAEKGAETADRYPRRTGMALKKPIISPNQPKRIVPKATVNPDEETLPRRKKMRLQATEAAAEPAPKKKKPAAKSGPQKGPKNSIKHTPKRKTVKQKAAKPAAKPAPKMPETRANSAKPRASGAPKTRDSRKFQH